MPSAGRISSRKSGTAGCIDHDHDAANQSGSENGRGQRQQTPGIPAGRTRGEVGGWVQDEFLLPCVDTGCNNDYCRSRHPPSAMTQALSSNYRPISCDKRPTTSIFAPLLQFPIQNSSFFMLNDYSCLKFGLSP